MGEGLPSVLVGGKLCGVEEGDMDGEDMGRCEGQVGRLVQLLRSRITLSGGRL